MIPRPTTRKRTFYSGPERPLRGVAAEYWKRTRPSGWIKQCLLFQPAHVIAMMWMIVLRRWVEVDPVRQG